MELEIGRELSFTDLDQQMIELGYGSEDEWIDWEVTAKAGQVYYSKDNGDSHTTIKFKVLSEHGKDETPSAAFIKIIDII